MTEQTFWTRKPEYPTLAETSPARQVSGRTIADPYQWMEDEQHPAIPDWLSSQNDLTDRLLRGGDRDHWQTKLDELESLGQVRTSVRVGGRTYQLENLGTTQPVLTAQDGETKTVLFDPNAGRNGDHPRKIVGWVVDPEGRMIAIEVHEGGEETGTVLLLDVRTGETTCALAGAAAYATVAWSPERICYVTGGRGRHSLASHTIADGTVNTVGVPVAGPTRLEVAASPDGRWLLLLTRAALGDAPALWIASWDSATPTWRSVHFGGTRISAWTIGFDNDLYVTDDSGTLVRFDLTDSQLKATTLVSGQDGTIDAMRALRGGALVCVRRVEFERIVEIRRPTAPEPVTLVRWLGRLRLGQVSLPEGDAVQLCFEDPAYGFWWAWVTGNTDEVTMPEHARLRVEIATSQDGEQVPVTLCDPSNGSGGPAPTVLFVYGGFGLNAEPTYEPLLAAWLRSGGRVGWIHARGGSELGQWWAEAGRGAGKARTVQDVCAVAAHLLETGQAGENQVAIIGASNGGLVAAAAVALLPDRFAAAVCVNPLTDMVRYPLAGLGKLWMAEYGDPAEPADLDVLLSYSPYHQVSQARRYPAVLLAVGTNNTRVPAWHAYKLCAALQASTRSEQPVLLDVDHSSGHNGRDHDNARKLAASTLTLLSRATGLTPA
jgi:prolyl oligopeptidase